MLLVGLRSGLSVSRPTIARRLSAEPSVKGRAAALQLEQARNRKCYSARREPLAKICAMCLSGGGRENDLASKERILSRAREQFLRVTSSSRLDGHLSLGKACLTIALEEEAAAQIFVQKALEAQSEAMFTSVTVNLGGESTWSLGRLDMLAAEVEAVFRDRVAAAGLENPGDVEAWLETLDPADRVGLNEVLQLKPKPQRPLPQQDSQPECPPSGDGPEDAGEVKQFPLFMISAINEVLYDRHGYRRSQQHGDPRESQLAAVLEDGQGSPVAMGILYMEICSRVGLPVAGMPVDDGHAQYFLLWPTKIPLKVGRSEYLIDPYSNGDLLEKTEACELLGLYNGATNSALQPASKCQILSALLSYMRESYWARAVGCSPEPAFIEPLDSRTVSELCWDMDWEEGTFNLRRAIACAERQVHLSPSCQKTQLQYALLQYAAGDYEAAWQELGVYLERGGGAEADGDASVRLLMERIRMYLEFGVTQRSEEAGRFDAGGA